MPLYIVPSKEEKGQMPQMSNAEPTMVMNLYIEQYYKRYALKNFVYN